MQWAEQADRPWIGAAVHSRQTRGDAHFGRHCGVVRLRGFDDLQDRAKGAGEGARKICGCRCQDAGMNKGAEPFARLFLGGLPAYGSWFGVSIAFEMHWRIRRVADPGVSPTIRRN
jgi:hypothetical protein